MSAAAAFAVVSAASNAAAQEAAHRAMLDRCRVEVAGYEPKTATVVEMQSYAQCIEALHPVDHALAGPELVTAKVAVALALVGIPLGIWYARKELGNDPVDIFMGGIIGAVVVPCAVAAVLLAGAGLVWLFT